ncbi:hypothetical protein OH492_13190 [Vibrio chagasii]|nr:hypothetical protein [Vibrio chagasii]
MLRTPYRIDIMQPKYYVINDLGQELFQISQEKPVTQQADLAIEAGYYHHFLNPRTITC